MQPVKTAIRFFSERELACKGTGEIHMDPRFARALPELREAWGKPLHPNSVCRTPAHNAAVGGHPRSMHLTDNPMWPTVGTMGCDLRWRGWPVEDQLAFARLAWSMGWAVGLHDGFIHIDRRGDLGLPNLPQNVFLYGTWSGAFAPQEVSV